MIKYTNSKTFCFKYNYEFQHNYIYNQIKKDIEDRTKELIKFIVFNKNKKTYCFLELNERIQTKDRFFLVIYFNNIYYKPIFYKCINKKKLLNIFNKYDFSYYN